MASESHQPDRWLDLIDGTGYWIVRRVFDQDAKTVAVLRRKLGQCGIGEPVEMYLSRALIASLLVGVLAATFAIGLAVVTSEPVSGGLGTGWWGVRVGITAGVAGLGGIGLALGAFWTRLSLVASNRRREIDYLLADAVSYMYALSTGGLNEVEVIEAMAEAEDAFGEVAREFQLILRKTRYVDVDYRTAIRERALMTPSSDLNELLTDMLSIVNSGGDLVDFFDDKKEKHMRAARHRQESTLETLELFGELYIALSLFPLLLIIVLVIMGIMGTGQRGLLYATVYGLIPIGNLSFLVLVSMVKRADPGDGYLTVAPGEAVQRSGSSPITRSGNRGAMAAAPALSARIDRRERLDAVFRRLRRPHVYFRDAPLRVLAVTIPVTFLALGYAVAAGIAPTSAAEFGTAPVVGTGVYFFLPVYLNAIPLAVFYEWDRRRRRPITGKLSDTLRKLSSANDTGLSLLESIETVAETDSGALAREFHEISARVRYGRSLHEALIEFNNRYHVPRLARIVKLIGKAQETSSRITNVLTTAAQASENQDELERERLSRTRLQVVIILMTYLTMLAVVVVLKTQFLNVMAEVMATSGSPVGVGNTLVGGADRATLELLLFHAVSIQAVLSGFISGYIREANILGGLKFVLFLTTVALSVWVVTG